MELSPGYKSTEVGVIPEDWHCVRVRNAAANRANAIVGGPFGSDLVSADYVESGVPVIRGKNMAGPTVSGEFVFVPAEKAKKLRANLASKGDVVFTQRGTLGQIAVVPDNAFKAYLISQSQMKLSLDRSRHDPFFLYQYFSSGPGQKQIIASAIQTGVPHTNLGILRDYRFPAPPLLEQRAIAAALSDMDALLDGLDRLIAKKRDLMRAAMQQLLTGRNRLPGFSGDWESKRIADVATSSSEKNSSRDKLPVLACSKHHGFVDSLGFFKNQVFSKDLATYKVIRRGEIGYPANHVEEGSIGLQDLYEVAVVSPIYVVFKVRQNINSFFLHRLLKLDSYRQAFKTATTSSVDRRGSLRWPAFSEIVVGLPPTLEEQTAIALALLDMEAELKALEARRDKTQALKQAMMQELLTGRTRLI
jgi:type I restriction enzyme S subunit